MPRSADPCILDIGTGNGLLAIVLADAGYDASRILGIDYSADSIRLAKAVAQHRGVPDLVFKTDDFLAEDSPLVASMKPEDAGSWDLL